MFTLSAGQERQRADRQIVVALRVRFASMGRMCAVARIQRLVVVQQISVTAPVWAVASVVALGAAQIAQIAQLGQQL